MFHGFNKHFLCISTKTYDIHNYITTGFYYKLPCLMPIKIGFVIFDSFRQHPSRNMLVLPGRNPTLI